MANNNEKKARRGRKLPYEYVAGSGRTYKGVPDKDGNRKGEKIIVTQDVERMIKGKDGKERKMHAVTFVASNDHIGTKNFANQILPMPYLSQRFKDGRTYHDTLITPEQHNKMMENCNKEGIFPSFYAELMPAESNKGSLIPKFDSIIPTEKGFDEKDFENHKKKTEIGRKNAGLNPYYGAKDFAAAVEESKEVEAEATTEAEASDELEP